MGRLDNKVAIVTGAAAGFGEAIAKHYVEEGAKVLVCDLNDEAGEKVAARSEALSFQHVDVSKKQDWDAAIQRAVELWGKVDILVNNAGTTYKNKSTNEVTEDEFDRVFAVNVKGVYLGCNAYTAQVLKQGTPGAIVNIASVGAHRPRPGLVWYNASKGCIANATMGLAAEYGPKKIRVNSICPLATMTGLLEQFMGTAITDDVKAKIVSAVPLGRLGEVRDVSNAAVWLASDEASFVTGVNLDVDGGRAI
ncbi:putative short-chain dehydrogenase reductase family [Diplodia seriata]|uniref:Putative short-chain dehydrogenase reductase family n=1 Tax=Diplodia seriata TaxID=420778 RepID=A0A0G2EFL1_9PEZI|nr:putative short-chain dehydrogenase reductase family [Diplodia seriata]